jgi:Uma2 family endonuclease
MHPSDIILSMDSYTTVLPDGLGLTCDELDELFGDAADGRRYELFDGVLSVSPSPRLRHQVLVERLYRSIRAAADAAGGKAIFPPFDVLFGRRTLVIPDVTFVSAERVGRITERGIEGAPDLVVEVLSASTEARDRGVKRSLYARHGVREYWIVDPAAAAVERHRLVDGELARVDALARGDTLRTGLLPELAIPLEELFAD